MDQSKHKVLIPSTPSKHYHYLLFIIESSSFDSLKIILCKRSPSLILADKHNCSSLSFVLFICHQFWLFLSPALLNNSHHTRYHLLTLGRTPPHGQTRGPHLRLMTLWFGDGGVRMRVYSWRKNPKVSSSKIRDLSSKNYNI